MRKQPTIHAAAPPPGPAYQNLSQRILALAHAHEAARAAEPPPPPEPELPPAGDEP